MCLYVVVIFIFPPVGDIAISFVTLLISLLFGWFVRLLTLAQSRLSCSKLVGNWRELTYIVSSPLHAWSRLMPKNSVSGYNYFV